MSRCASRGRLMNMHSGSNKSINVIKETANSSPPSPSASQQVRGNGRPYGEWRRGGLKGNTQYVPDSLSAFQQGCVFHNATVLQGPYISSPQPVRYCLLPAMQIRNMFTAREMLNFDYSNLSNSTKVCSFVVVILVV